MFSMNKLMMLGRNLNNNTYINIIHTFTILI